MNSLNQSYNPKDYWEIRLSKDFSLTGVGHAGFGSHYNKWMYKARLRSLDRVLKIYSIRAKEGAILDIGCGTGFYIDYWKRKGAGSITGIDITRKSISFLQARYPEYRFIEGDISQNELDLKEKFDIITVFDVLFHVIDDSKFERAISNIKRLSKATSLVLITDLFLKYYSPPRGHEYDRTFVQYKKCLENQGFEILGKAPVFVLMGTPMDIKSELIRKWANFLWINIMRNLRRLEFCENIGGAFLYLLDGVLTRFMADGPNTEIMVCRLRK